VSLLILLGPGCDWRVFITVVESREIREKYAVQVGIDTNGGRHQSNRAYETRFVPHGQQWADKEL
jgi:hypothetical protein